MYSVHKWENPVAISSGILLLFLPLILWLCGINAWPFGFLSYCVAIPMIGIWGSPESGE